MTGMLGGAEESASSLQAVLMSKGTVSNVGLSVKICGNFDSKICWKSKLSVGIGRFLSLTDNCGKSTWKMMHDRWQNTASPKSLELYVDIINDQLLGK